MTTPTCYRHPGAEAFSTCPSCTQTICSVCETIHGTRYYCPPCAKKARARASMIKGAVALLLVAGLGAAGYQIAQYEPPFDYGKDAATITKLQDQLAKEPCDRSKIIELGEALNAAGDYRGAIETSDAFFKQCGDYERLLWVPYHAHKRLSEWPQAAAAATRLIEADPYDKDYRWWRGITYENAGDFEKAAADYEQAIALVPKLNSIPINLANMYEKLNRPCDAIFPLEQLRFYRPAAANDERLSLRLDTLYARPECEAMSGEGKAVVKFPRGATIIIARAEVNGKAGRFIVDTGASYVALTPSFAAKAGLTTDGSILLKTASGVVTGQTGSVDAIKLDGVTAHRVKTVVLPGLEDGNDNVDGLLGLSFLSRFEVSVDHASGKLTLDAG
jgi:clan AA aspartic protease (TIGR02281 family)